MKRRSSIQVRLSKALGCDPIQYVKEAYENGLPYPLITAELYAKTNIYVNPMTLNRWILDLKGCKNE